MITKEEFKKTYIRMMDSYRKDGVYKGEPNCRGLSCNNACPFYGVCCDNEIDKGSDLTYNVFEIIEMVEEWGKEHPLITRADKYKEVFGIQPKYNGDDVFICPGKAKDDYWCRTHSCEGCKEDYWNGEYVEPEKED